jgi:hypothetical protein
LGDGQGASSKCLPNEACSHFEGRKEETTLQLPFFTHAGECGALGGSAATHFFALLPAKIFNPTVTKRYCF